MEVVQSNFEQFFDDFSKFLPESEIVSFDLEFTGIKNDGAYYDLPQEKYQKYQITANKYKIIQVGLCLFIKQSDDTYQIRPYNIYVFPKSTKYYSPQICLDVSSVEFNTKNNMNWQKWFTEGVHYVQKQSKKYKNYNNAENEDKQIDQIYNMSEDQNIEKVNKILSQVDEWFNSEKTNDYDICADDENMLLYYQQEIQTKYKYKVQFLVESQENQKILKVFRSNAQYEQEQEQLIKQKQEYSQLKLQGFSYIYQLISKSQKPIVGHNCLFDIMFLQSHFYKHLKPNYDKFLKKVHKQFPTIFDTKYIFQNLEHLNKLMSPKNTSLQELYQYILSQENPEYFAQFKYKFPESGFNRYSLNDQQEQKCYHEAGYDAMITGILFLNIFHKLDNQQKLSVKNNINNSYAIFNINFEKSPAESFDERQKIFVIYRKQEKPNQKDKQLVYDKQKQIQEKLQEKLPNVQIETRVHLQSYIMIKIFEQYEHRDILVTILEKFKDQKNKFDLLTFESYQQHRQTFQKI